MLWVITATKGSPGATTATLALAAAASSEVGPDHQSRISDVVLAELDPAGGDLECWCGPLGEPGLLAVAGGTNGLSLQSHAVEVIPGVMALVGPTSEASMTAALLAAGEGFVEQVRDRNTLVVADVGRWTAHGPRVAADLAHAADVVVVVCRPTLAGVEHARGLVASLRSLAQRVVLVLSGHGPYGPGEVSPAVGADVVGLLPWDPRGITTLLTRGMRGRRVNTGFALAARSTVSNLFPLPGIVPAPDGRGVVTRA